MMAAKDWYISLGEIPPNRKQRDRNGRVDTAIIKMNIRLAEHLPQIMDDDFSGVVSNKSNVSDSRSRTIPDEASVARGNPKKHKINMMGKNISRPFIWLKV